MNNWFYICIGLFIMMLFINSCSINKEKRGDDKPRFMRPFRYDTGLDCGRPKCGGEFSIQEYWSNGNRGTDINKKLEIQKMQSEFIVGVYNVVQGKCSLLNEIRVNEDVDSLGYHALRSLVEKMSIYNGEPTMNKYCFDSPWSVLVWGNDEKCSQMTLYCNELPLMGSNVMDLEKTALSLLGYENYSNLFQLHTY